MAGGTGALGAEGMGTRLRSGIEAGGAGTSAREAAIMKASGVTPPPMSFFQGAENLTREGLAQAADFLGG